MKTPLHGYLSRLLPLLLALATSLAAQSHSPLAYPSKSTLPVSSWKGNRSLVSLRTAGINEAEATPPPAPEAITGPTVPCYYSQVTYSIAPVSGAASYTWNLPTGWAVLSGQGTTTITVRVGSGAGQVSVRAANEYGESPSVSMAVEQGSELQTTGSVSGSSALCAGSTSAYSVPVVANAERYQWTVPEGWVIQSGQGTLSITVTAGSTGGNLLCQAFNACGTSYQFKAVEITPGGEVRYNTIASAYSLCPGQTPPALTGSTPSVSCNNSFAYQWESSTDQLHFTPIQGAVGRDYTPEALYATTWFRRRVIAGTTSSHSNVLQVTVLPTPVTPEVAPVAVYAGSAATLSVQSPEPYTTYYWSDAAGKQLGKGTTFTTPPLTSASTFYVLPIGNCPGERTKVEVSLFSSISPPVAAATTACAGGSATLLVEQADPTKTYSWYGAATGGLSLASNLVGKSLYYFVALQKASMPLPCAAA